MKILIAASEMVPFAGSDAFGGEVAAVASGLQALGHEVSVVLPYYRSVRDLGPGKAKATGAKVSVPLGSGRYSGEIREGRAPGGVQVFFVERDEFFDRSGLYGVDDRDYQDNAARFIFFSKVVVELVRLMDPTPDLVFACNWQTGLVPALMSVGAGPKVPVVLGAQSLEYQGNFWSYDFGLTNLPGSYFSASGLEFYGSMNFLKGGVMFADAVVLPGPRYVSEVQTAVAGCGMEAVMREHATKLEGVTPGSSGSDWNPATDKSLVKRFKTPESRMTAQAAGWKAVGFREKSRGAALVLSTEIMISDGLEIALGAFDLLAEAGAQLLVLGQPGAESSELLEFAIRKHRGRLVHNADAKGAIWRQAIASCDALLLPAPTLPDARPVLQAMRYGAVPVSLACGGMHQVAAPVDKVGAEGIGFYFYEPSVAALADAVRGMDACRQAGVHWNALVSRTMATDLTWTAAAAGLENVFAHVIQRGSTRRAA